MKKTIRILAVIIAMTCIFSGTAFAQEKEVAVEKSSSIARADVIKYVYKVEKFSVQGVQTRLKRNDRFEISDRVAN